MNSFKGEYIDNSIVFMKNLSIGEFICISHLNGKTIISKNIWTYSARDKSYNQNSLPTYERTNESGFPLWP